MKRNDKVMFSLDGKRFQKSHFLDDCGQLDAVKIKLSGEEWTVKKNQVCSMGEWMKVRAQNFYLDNEKAISAWRDAHVKMSNDTKLKISKASIARSLKIEPSTFGRILKQWNEIHAPCLK